jgi:CBS domain-containing protein
METERRHERGAWEKEAEMTIAAILRSREQDSIITVAPEMPVSDVLALLADKRIGAVPVMDGDDLVGIMSERDLIYGLRRDGSAFLDLPVRKAMTSAVITVSSDTTPFDALSMMTRRRIRHLPVVDDGLVVGFVSIGDLVKARIEAVEREAAAMRDYIQTA